MKKIAFFLLIVSFVFSSFLLTPTQAEESKEARPPGLRLLQEEPSWLLFEINTPDYELVGEHIQVSGYQTLSLEGAPELPLVSTLINVPPQAEVEVHVLVEDRTTLPGTFAIPPAPTRGEMIDDFTTGPDQIIPNEEIYESDAFFPESPVQLGKGAWMRDQRLVPLQIFPFQYNPKQGKLVWYKTLRVKVTFSDTARNAPVKSPLNAAFSSAVINHPAEEDSSTQGAITPNAPLYAPTLTEAAYKITVEEDGLYHVTYDELQAAGMDVDNVDPTEFKLTSQGQEIAIDVEGEGDGSFDSGDYISFYGQKFRGDRLASLYETAMEGWTSICYRCELKDVFEKYTDENVYWLHLDSAGGPRMDTRDGTPDGSTVPDYYMATAHAEESIEWFSWHLTSGDTWFWEKVRDTELHTYATTLNAIADTAPVNATVRGELVSRATTNHDTHIFLNSEDNPVDEALWNGFTDHDFSAEMALSLLNEGNNDVLFRNDIDGDYLYFNWFEIEYPRQFQAQDEEIFFSYDEGGTSWQYEIDNFASANVEAFDISNPISPVRITNATFGSGTLTFSASQSTETDYFAIGSNGVKSVKEIAYYTPLDVSNLTEVDYIFITHSDFSATLASLATYHQNQGLSTLIVDIDDLYNSFNYGIYHSIAIKNFLAYTFDNWSTPPSYALLVGNGHFNLKNYTGTIKWDTTDPNFVPPNLAFVDPNQGTTDSNNLLVTLVGDDPLPDMAIGRLPINTTAELNSFITKITNYAQASPLKWQQNVIQVADNPDSAGDFVASSDTLINTHVAPSPYKAIKIYLNDYNDGAAANADLIDTINTQGALLVTYMGHASTDRWASEEILVSDDVPDLTNSNKLPIFLSLDCLDGFWSYPENPSLAGELLRSDAGGSIGAFAPTGLGLASGHDALGDGFYEALITNNTTDFGAVTLASKLALYGTGNNYDLLDTYTLFGDPALQIPTPPPNGTFSDYDGDGKSDPAKFYPGTGTVWWLASSTGSWDGLWLGGDTFDYVTWRF